MADKETCPGCDSTTSNVLRAFEDGEPCPHCGLSASAAQEIDAARERHANAELTEKYAEAVKRADKAEQEASELRRYLADVKAVIDRWKP